MQTLKQTQGVPLCKGPSPYIWLPLCSSHSPCPSSLLRLALTTPPEVWGCTYGSHSWRWPTMTLLFLLFLPSLWDGFPSLTQASILLLRATSLTPYFLALLPCVLPAAALHQDSRASRGGPFCPCFPSVTSSRCVTPTPPCGSPSLLSRLQVCLPSAVGPTGNTTASCSALALLSVPTPSDGIRPITPLSFLTSPYSCH